VHYILVGARGRATDPETRGTFRHGRTPFMPHDSVGGGERELTRGPAQQGASARAEDGPVGWFIPGGPKAGSEAHVSLLRFPFSFMSPFSYFVLF
jgi:hypothetical protein